MVSPLAVAVRARIDLVLACALSASLLCGAARADDVDADILGDDTGWKLEETRARVSAFVQRGQGYQSAWGSVPGPGSEDAWIVEPQLAFRVRQSDELRHDVRLGIDIVTAASPDAVDLITEASRVTEAGMIDITTTYAADDTDYSAHYGTDLEEHFKSFFMGVDILWHVAEDNTLVRLGGNVVADFFDPITIRGRDFGLATRGTVDVELAFSQLLSPTTIFDADYMLAFQGGVLETTYNSVPQLHATDTPPRAYGYVRTNEKMPDDRYRHALSVRLAQHIPITHSTLKGSYRFYADTFGLFGHTAEIDLRQYLGPWLALRGSYRLHVQNGVEFYMSLAPTDLDEENRTADSDLAPFIAREVGAQVVFYRGRAPAAVRDDDTIDASYSYYWRTNDLHVHVLSLGYARSF
jgi:uncharacterized protein DUF3570